MGPIGCSRYSISRVWNVCYIPRFYRSTPGREAWCLVRAHPRQIPIHSRHSPRFQDRWTTERKVTRKRNLLKIVISENPGFGIPSRIVRENASRAKPGFSGLGEIWGDSAPLQANRLSLIYGAILKRVNAAYLQVPCLNKLKSRSHFRLKRRCFRRGMAWVVLINQSIGQLRRPWLKREGNLWCLH